jgi:hypothetical protein
MDIVFKTRLTPSDKSQARPSYRCPECRNESGVAAAAS